jgi:hypothetical protein
LKKLLLAAGCGSYPRCCSSPAERIPALVVDQPRLPQQIERIAQASQMSPQIAARSIAEAQFLYQVRILQTSILQILDRFGMAVELHLVKGGGSREQLGLRSQSDFLFQTDEALAEGEVLGKLHKADQVTATLTSVAIEQILADIDIERRSRIRVQRAESHELLSRGDAATGPVAPLQVLQQRNMLFDLFQILAHEYCFPFWDELRGELAAFPGEDGG